MKGVVTHLTGVRRYGVGPVDLETASVPDAGEHVGRERVSQGQQVLLHDHLSDQPNFDGDYHYEDVTVQAAHDFVRGHTAG